MNAVKRIIVRGPALSRSGYGEQTRFALRSLRAFEDRFDIYLIPTEWGKTGWLGEDTEEHAWIDSLARKTSTYINSGGQFDISLQVTIPNEWERLAPVNVGYTAGIETTKVAPQWLQASQIMDKIIVVSNHSKNVYEATSFNGVNQQTGEEIKNLRCQTPIDAVNYATRDVTPKKLDLDLETDFNFLAVAQLGPRKNMENTIRWFLEEFIDKEVGLVLKVNIMRNCTMDRNYTKTNLKKILRSPEYKDRKCKVYLLHGNMTDEEMHGLYVEPKIKALVTLAHGEGFGLPIFEAAYSGLPVISTNWSGQLDFLYKPTEVKPGKFKNKALFAKVDYRLAPVQPEVVWDGVLIKESMWAYPEQGSYKMKLRSMYTDYGRHKSQAKKLQEWIKEEFSPERKYAEFADSVYKPTKQALEWSSEINEMEVL